MKRFVHFILLGVAVYFGGTACSKSTSNQSTLTSSNSEASRGKTESSETLEPSSSPAVEEKNVHDAKLEGGQWVLKEQLPSTRVHMSFLDGVLSGNGGVNEYSCCYISDGESLAIEQFQMTCKGGPKPVMDQENKFVQTLKVVSKYRIVGEELHFLNTEGQVLLVFVQEK